VRRHETSELWLWPLEQGSRILRKWATVAVALAGLTGASGIILAAVAAHAVPDQRLETAANFLQLHAAATLAVCGLSFAMPRQGVWFLGAAGLFLCGSLLFGGDLTARVLAGTRLFSMAAPLGGTLLIIGWVFVILAAVVALRHTVDGKMDQNIVD
jgi:uncharacterized membrane protein YgdD (TMEM256/DUF423 family)